jgi:hypothetical protein
MQVCSGDNCRLSTYKYAHSNPGWWLHRTITTCHPHSRRHGNTNPIPRECSQDRISEEDVHTYYLHIPFTLTTSCDHSDAARYLLVLDISLHYQNIFQPRILAVLARTRLTGQPSQAHMSESHLNKLHEAWPARCCGLAATNTCVMTNFVYNGCAQPCVMPEAYPSHAQYCTTLVCFRPTNQ